MKHEDGSFPKHSMKRTALFLHPNRKLRLLQAHRPSVGLPEKTLASRLGAWFVGKKFGFC